MRTLNLNNDTARLIKEARERAGLTQRELAERIGTTQSAISDYETGRNSPTASSLQRLAEAMDLRLELRLIPPTR